jgi:hypothetical protein
MVRAMTDDEARRAQISENLQRQDVHPIEEAEGFQALIDDTSGPTRHTADTIAEQFGKSRSYVYGRLKLLQACPEIRKACLAGEIGSEVALLIARIPPKLQEKALTAIKNDGHSKLTDGGKSSFRAIRDLLAEKFTLDLDTAMFDIDDEMLLPEAGYCGRCPKRTGNAPEYGDLATQRDGRYGTTRPGSPDICTDPDCFEAKKKAHLKREAGKLEARGLVVVQGSAARNAISARGEVRGAYVALKDVKADLKKLPKKSPKKGSAAVQDQPALEIVQIQDPRTGKTVQAVKREALKTAGVKVAEPKAADDYAARQKRELEQRKKREAEADTENDVRMTLLQHVRTRIADTPRDAFDLRLVANVALGGVAYSDKPIVLELWGAKSAEALAKRIDTMEVAAITQLIMDCGLVRNLRVSQYSLNCRPEILYAVAKHYEINLAAVRAAAAAAAPTPALAARAPAKAAAGAKELLAAVEAENKAHRAARGKKEQKDDAGVAGGSGAQVDAFDEADA